MNTQKHFQPQHLAEFSNSAIAPDLLELNFSSINQESAFSFLIPNPARRNDGRLTDRHLRTFNSLETGGWICTGICSLTMKISEWGCLKPNAPRWDETKRKNIKYEHPHGVPTELFCLRVTYRIGLKIAQNNGLIATAQYLERMVGKDPTAEDRDFWQWVLDNPYLPIILTEGAKKTASLLSAGHLAIGLPGVWGGYRSKINGVNSIPHLIPHLKIFAAKEREIIFCFDKDTNPKTINNVNNAITKTGKLLERLGCQISVITWICPCKGVDDLIYNFGEDFLTHTVNNRQRLDKWRLGTAFNLGQLPKINVHHRYLDSTVKPDNLGGKLIALKSAKGTGKTEWAGDILIPEINKGRSVLVITHRIQLAKELAHRLGINHLSEVRHSDTGSLFGYSLCVDSLHPTSQARFNPEDWENSILVIDECEQVLWHMLNSPTCQQNRITILQTFEKLLRHLAESNGTIILADADLSKVSIDYIQNLTDNQLELWLLNNSYNPNQGKRKLFNYQSPANLLEAANKAIEDGEQIIIHCSSQKVKSKWSTQNLETFIQTAHQGKSILRIDAETVSDPTHPAYGCIERINEIVAQYDIVLASPVIETGISIDASHFDSVWTIANGVQTVDAVCQTIERVRSDVPRHICITTSGITKIGNGSDSPWHLAKSQAKTAISNLSALSLSGFTEDSANHLFHLDTWSHYAARINQGYQNYQQNILNKLQHEGYEIIDLTPNPDPLPATTVKAQIEAAKGVNYQAERTAKVDAPNPNDIELKELQQKTAKTKQERHIQAKGKLTRRYLTEDITDELILKDDGGWYPQLQLYYYLTIRREYLPERDKNKLQSLSPNGIRPFTPDINKTALSVKVMALEAVDIGQFLREDMVFTKDSLTEWHERLRGCSADLQNYLGVTIGDKSTPITTAQRLLSLLGYKLEPLDRIRINGKLVRRYGGVECNADERYAVLNRWLEQDERVVTAA
jgi:Domain of unknown function (DUF3854)